MTPTYFLSRDFFLRFLSAIYCIAFISLGVQIGGLIGERGILPAVSFLKAVKEQWGPARYWVLPTLCWFNSSDSFLKFLCFLGALLSLLSMTGFCRAPILFLLWVLYLSLVTVGQDFMEFQWDSLLLEAGFLGIFLAFSPRALWLLRWLLFRLVFSSGAVKLASGDPSWRNLTALHFHYETQPLPTCIGWYFHQLPGWFQTLSVAVMFGIELVVPFFIFFTSRFRLAAAFFLIVFQILIAATGNYCFFNLLAIALCVLLIDDATWRKDKPSIFQPKEGSSWWLVPLAVVMMTVTSIQMAGLLRIKIRWPRPMIALYQGVAPFRSINSYGLFAVMTTTRPEIIVEGSNDGKNWLAYEFKWKPGDLKKHPAFVAPHQPRLDWQMWFAALGSYRENPWLVSFIERLLEGRQEVLELLGKNPFPAKPPRYIRAQIYEYRFTDWGTQYLEKKWWRREFKGSYLPVLSRRQGP